MATGIEKILEKTGLKSKDINAKNYKKLKSLLSDDDIKIVEKKLGVDKLAEASKKKQKEPDISIQQYGKVKDKGPNPGDAGGSTEKPIKVKKGKVKVDTKTGEIVKLAKGGDPSEFGMLSVKAGVDNNPKPTQADRIVGATKKMKKGGIVKKKPSRTRIAKRGFGIAKRGY